MGRLASPHVFIRWIPLAGIGLALFFYGQFLYLHAMNIPFADDILDVLQVMSGLIGADQPGQSLELLFAQHNDHRTTSSRLLYYLSYAAEGEINFRTLTFVANFALIMILLVMYLAIRDHFAPWLLLLPAALVLFQLRAYGLTLWSMAAFAYFYVYLYGFACLLMLRNINGVRFIFAILLASLATFTLASGQMIWLVGVVSLLQQVAVRKKVPLSYVAVWLGAAIAVMLAWRVGLETPNTLLYVLDFFIQKPWYQLTYYFVLLGNAVTEESVTVAATAGGLMFLLLCYSTFRNRRAGNILPELFGWYIVFSVIAMTLGRAPYSDIEYALSSRYSFPSILMLANSCILVFYRLDRRYLKLFRFQFCWPASTAYRPIRCTQRNCSRRWKRESRTIIEKTIGFLVKPRKRQILLSGERFPRKSMFRHRARIRCPLFFHTRTHQNLPANLPVRERRNVLIYCS